MKDCSTCRHRGWDPDGTYCAAPAVIAVRPHGCVEPVVLGNVLDDRKASPAYGLCRDYALWEELTADQKRAFSDLRAIIRDNQIVESNVPSIKIDGVPVDGGAMYAREQPVATVRFIGDTQRFKGYVVVKSDDRESTITRIAVSALNVTWYANGSIALVDIVTPGGHSRPLYRMTKETYAELQLWFTGSARSRLKARKSKSGGGKKRDAGVFGG